MYVLQVEPTSSRVIKASQMKIGDIARIAGNRSYSGEIVLRAYESLVVTLTVGAN